MEVEPGIHRTESILGPRPFSQYLLRGERTLPVDTGEAETPQDVSEALAEHGELNLRGLLEAANPKLSPFTVMENELAGTLRTHVRQLVAAGQGEELPGSAPATWKATPGR